ncbi:hypothetical protein ZWY2020_052286 [Hordeum vulgare]|nr:hypothetical protein ZWY2020_052286 [Hordeum vulgare]
MFTPSPPLPVALTPEEIAGAIRDLTIAVQGICLFLAGPYGPPPAAPSVTAYGPAWLPWQPPHQAAFAAIAGPRQPTLLLSSPPLDARLLQPPLPFPVSGPIHTAAWAPPHIQSPLAPPQQYGGPSCFANPDGAPFHGGSSMVTAPTLTPAQPPPPPSAATTAPVITFQHGMPYDGSDDASAAPPPSQGNPIQQIKFQPSSAPLPAWIATHHVSAAVRLQAAARGLLARRHVQEMRDLKLQLHQVALRGATDLDLVRCVGDLGHAVSPTGGEHAVFPRLDLQVCDIDDRPGRRHGVTDRAHCQRIAHSPAEGSLGPDGVLGIQGAANAQVRRTKDSRLIVRSQK